jgi:hypothetical protein
LQNDQSNKNLPQGSSHVPPLLVPQNEQTPTKQAIHILVDDQSMINKMIELLHCDLLDQFDVADYIDWPVELKHPEKSEIFEDIYREPLYREA